LVKTSIFHGPNPNFNPEVEENPESTNSVPKGLSEKGTYVPRVEKDLGVPKEAQDVDPNAAAGNTEKEGAVTQDMAMVI